MKHPATLIPSLLILLGCHLNAAPTEPTTPATPAEKPAPAKPVEPPAKKTPPAKETRDGSSFEKAVVIKARNESEGVPKEYAWLKSRYPGYKLVSQSLKTKDEKSFDVMKITTKDGSAKDVYFDISDFYGKLD